MCRCRWIAGLAHAIPLAWGPGHRAGQQKGTSPTCKLSSATCLHNARRGRAPPSPPLGRAFAHERRMWGRMGSRGAGRSARGCGCGARSGAQNRRPRAESHHSSHCSHSPTRHPSDRSPRQGPRQGQGPRSGLGRGPRQGLRHGQGPRLGSGRGPRHRLRQGPRSGARSGLGRGPRQGLRQGALPGACLAKVAVGLARVAPYVAWFGPGPLRGDFWQMLGKHGGFWQTFWQTCSSPENFH